MFVEVLNLGVDLAGAIDAAVLSFELICGVCVGIISVRIHSLVLRHLPFICVASLTSAYGYYLLSTPPTSGMPAPSDDNAMALICREELGNCTAVQNCVMASIDEGQLPSWDQGQLFVKPDETGAHPTTIDQGRLHRLAMALFLAEMCRRVIGLRILTIAGETLGLEVANGSSTQFRRIVDARAFSAGSGAILAPLAMIKITTIYADSIMMQVRKAVLLPIVGLPLAGCFLVFSTLRQVRSSGTQMKATSSARKVLSSVQSTLPMLKTIMANKVFQYAIVIDLASSSTMVIHISTIFFYFKYIKQIENASRAQITYVSMLGVSAMVSMPFLTYLSPNNKRQSVMCAISFMAAVACFSVLVFSKIALVMPIVWGLFEASQMLTLPECVSNAVLYDEVLHGSSRPVIFIAMKSNLEQFVMIFVAVLPGAVLATSGYVGNGGCRCGCGARCTNSFMAWDCPADVGYVCSEGLGGNTFSGPARQPACTGGQPPSVNMAIMALVFLIPGALLLVPAVLLAAPPINEKQLRAMRAARLAKGVGGYVIHPLTGKPDTFGDDSHVRNTLDHFSQEEVLKVARIGLPRFRSDLVSRLYATVFLFMVIALLSYSWSMLSIGIPIMTLVLLRIVWDFRRFLELFTRSQLVSYHLHIKRWHQSPARSSDRYHLLQTTRV